MTKLATMTTMTGSMTTMTDELVKRLRDPAFGTETSERNLMASAADRIEQLTAERDAAYAQGYADAETEISKSALGQKIDFLIAEYANAVDRITDLNELLDEAQTEWSKYASAWMTAEGKLADAEALIEAQAKDHASNNIRFAEAEHRAKTSEAERDRLREALTALHKQALMLRGEQAYREFARAVEKQSRAALKGESHE